MLGNGQAHPDMAFGCPIIAVMLAVLNACTMAAKSAGVVAPSVAGTSGGCGFQKNLAGPPTHCQICCDPVALCH